MSKENKTLTKMDIIKALSEKHNLPLVDVKRIVQGMLDSIIETVIKGNRIELRDFGVFEVVERKGRPARNIKQKTTVYIPSRKIVKFRQGKIMDDKITRASISQQKTLIKEVGKNELS